ncbi:hypothetical protein VdG1_01694 [Verticillium dahliae VDG1]|nr:hypothetical protein VdG1_01694 [Verticillium dahliae VDG1]
MYTNTVLSTLAAAGMASAYIPARRQETNGTVTTTTVTEVVSELATWCPEPTNYVTWEEKVYTVEGPTWFTITDCPCTVTRPH